MELKPYKLEGWYFQRWKTSKSSKTFSPVPPTVRVAQHCCCPAICCNKRKSTMNVLCMSATEKWSPCAPNSKLLISSSKIKSFFIYCLIYRSNYLSPPLFTELEETHKTFENIFSCPQNIKGIYPWHFSKCSPQPSLIKSSHSPRMAPYCRAPRQLHARNECCRNSKKRTHNSLEPACSHCPLQQWNICCCNVYCELFPIFT